jgi:hypothetical protein
LQSYPSSRETDFGVDKFPLVGDLEASVSLVPMDTYSQQMKTLRRTKRGVTMGAQTPLTSGQCCTLGFDENEGREDCL